MAANDFAAQNGTEKLSTNALETVNGVNVAADVIEVQRNKMGFGADGALIDVSATTPLPVVALKNGVISTVNSSAVALGISGVFTGASEDVTEFADVRVYVFSDQTSATDGLQLQQSSNGTNWDIADSYTIPASTGKTFSVGVSAKFFRVVYTNTATAQTVFRMQVKYSQSYTKGSSVRPQDGRGRDNDMEEGLSYLMGYNGTSMDMLRSTIANGLAVDVSRVVATVSVAGTRSNAGTGVVANSFHLTVGGSDGTNLRPMSVDTTGRLNVNGAVTGTFFQTTQPVSGAFFQATQPVSGTFFQATQPVSIAAAIVATGPAAAPLSLDATLTNHTQRLQAVTTLTTISAANTTITLTLPAVAAQFHYITRIRISMHNTSAAAVVGSAVTLGFTSSNVPGALAWTEGNALAAGTSKVVCDEVLTNSIKSTTVNTASTIVAPACGAGVLVRITAYYYTAA